MKRNSAPHSILRSGLLVFVMLMSTSVLWTKASWAYGLTRQQQNSPPTTVFCPEPDKDFGVVPPGSKLEHTFLLVNPTNEPVLIRKVVPTCQCTTASVVEGKYIPANGSLPMPVTLQIPSTTGIKKAAVNMILSSGVGPRLTLNAESAYAVRTIPPYINAFDRPENMSGAVVVSSVDGKPFRVLSVARSKPKFLNDAGEGDIPRAQHVLQYDLSTYKCENMPKWLLIETDHPNAPLIEIRIRHTCTKLKHQMQPNSIAMNFDGWIANVGAIPIGGSGEFTIEIKDFPGQKIDSVISLSPSFKTDLIEQRPGDGDRLQVKVAIKPLINKTGVFQIPVQFISGRKAEAITVVGTVR